MLEILLVVWKIGPPDAAWRRADTAQERSVVIRLPWVYGHGGAHTTAGSMGKVVTIRPPGPQTLR